MKEIQNKEMVYPGNLGTATWFNGQVTDITQIESNKDGSVTLTFSPRKNTEPETEEAQFEIIQPKQLK